ncbi:MAG TPA: hypothetical protein VKD90_27250 [Gemmataceae bacterium]|nr:hypothetical protein [Gemmataceae bacterium]
MRRLVVPTFVLALFAAGTAHACFFKCFRGKPVEAVEPPAVREFERAPYLVIVSVNGQAPDPVTGWIPNGIDSTQDLEVVVESNVQIPDPGPDLILTDEGPHTITISKAKVVPKSRTYKRYKHQKKPHPVAAGAEGVGADAVLWQSFFKVPGGTGGDLSPNRNYRLDAKYPGVVSADPVRFWTLP